MIYAIYLFIFMPVIAIGKKLSWFKVILIIMPYKNIIFKQKLFFKSKTRKNGLERPEHQVFLC